MGYLALREKPADPPVPSAKAAAPAGDKEKAAPTTAAAETPRPKKPVRYEWVGGGDVVAGAGKTQTVGSTGPASGTTRTYTRTIKLNAPPSLPRVSTGP